MKTIWKFSTLKGMDFKERFIIKMPKGAEILTVQVDEKNNHPTIWALVDTEADVEYRNFVLVGTGNPIGTLVDKKYIGTYQYQRGEFVGHIFELID
jgi:hypothetical protein